MITLITAMIGNDVMMRWSVCVFCFADGEKRCHGLDTSECRKKLVDSRRMFMIKASIQLLNNA